MTAYFTAARSPIRQLMMAIVGMFLLVAALDIVSLHRLSDAPSVNDDGLLTPKGQTERRTDLVWGTLFVVAGGALLAVGFGGWVRGRSAVELHDDVLRLRVAGPLATLDIDWHDVVSIRSGRDYDDDGRIPIPVLLIEVDDRTKYPDGLWGAVWDGNTLQVDADGWATTVEDVVIRAEMMLDRPQEGEYP
ncbi:MAG: hypothetical protein QNL12_11150 [Acidimicrobiia bacterium]|nr:hypothetical protein [Acidimicrobiia bacterium]MDX2467862.1 hypothetical protein [Acidimicrobiia bacterium]